MNSDERQVPPGIANDGFVREMVHRHQLAAPAIVAEMRRAGLCAGSEDEMVGRLLDGGECTLAVALAVFAGACRNRSGVVH